MAAAPVAVVAAIALNCFLAMGEQVELGGIDSLALLIGGSIARCSRSFAALSYQTVEASHTHFTDYPYWGKGEMYDTGSVALSRQLHSLPLPGARQGKVCAGSSC